MAQEKTDIATKEHISALVDTFYQRVVEDDLLAPFFKHLDFDKHLPKMKHFWAFALLDEPGYTTNVTDVHLKMRINKTHFDRWVALFSETVDAMYLGKKAQEAKQRAALIGWTLAEKMK